MNLIQLISKRKEYLYFLTVLFIFFLLRLPSLFEPNWYGDEGIYQVLGMAINQGRLLYRDIWDNKPPLLYLLYAIAGSDQFTIRLLSLLTGLICVFIFYKLAKILFSKSTQKNNGINIPFITTGLFVILFGSPLLEGNIGNAENFMMLPILISAYLIYKNPPIQNKRYLFFAGLLLAIATLFKIVAVFDTAAFFLFLFFVLLKAEKSIKKIIHTLLPYVLGFLIPILITCFYFIGNHAFLIFISATFSQNIQYVGSGNTLIIAKGLLYIKLLSLAVFVLFIYLKRKLLHEKTIFILLWIAFSLFNAFFSQRPYTHYLLVLLPSFLLVTGLLLEKLSMHSQLTKQKTMLFAGIYIVIFCIIIKNFSFYQKTISYYSNFAKFVTKNETLTDYRYFFDHNTPKDYAIASYINSHALATDTIFVWGNDAQLYTLTHKLPQTKYTVAYHITANATNITDMQNVLMRSEPKYIIISVMQDVIPYSLNNYTEKFSYDNGVIYERNY